MFLRPPLFVRASYRKPVEEEPSKSGITLLDSTVYVMPTFFPVQPEPVGISSLNI
jgi:hypothetical protein